MLDHSCQVQRHPHAERGLDLYETPSVAVEALLRVEKIPHRIWECAAGRGAPARGFRARASDMLPDCVPPLRLSANILTERCYFRRTARNQLMQQLLIRKDRIFMGKYLTNGVWGTDVTGTAGGTPGSATPASWSDDANGDPFTDIATAQTTILQNTGFEANTLLISFPVYQALRKHPLVVDRIKYTTRADASRITPDLLASAFDVDRCIVSKAVYNTTTEQAVGGAGGVATPTYSFIASKDALLCYAAPAPGIMVPTAGYIFAWSGLTGLNNMGVRVAQIPMPWLGLETVR